MGGVTVEDIDQCFPKCNIMLRPRGTLARTLYNKYLSDEHLECLDKAEVCSSTLTVINYTKINNPVVSHYIPSYIHYSFE